MQMKSEKCSQHRNILALKHYLITSYDNDNHEKSVVTAGSAFQYAKIYSKFWSKRPFKLPKCILYSGVVI